MVKNRCQASATAIGRKTSVCVTPPGPLSVYVDVSSEPVGSSLRPWTAANDVIGAPKRSTCTGRPAGHEQGTLIRRLCDVAPPPWAALAAYQSPSPMAELSPLVWM